jgi:formate dehydrogenase iron-sulfur subunit
VPFEQLGLRANLPSTPLPQLTWRILSHTPHIASLAAVALGGIYWITHRREEVAAAEGSPRGRSDN